MYYYTGITHCGYSVYVKAGVLYMRIDNEWSTFPNHLQYWVNLYFDAMAKDRCLMNTCCESWCAL